MAHTINPKHVQPQADVFAVGTPVAYRHGAARFWYAGTVDGDGSVVSLKGRTQFGLTAKCEIEQPEADRLHALERKWWVFSDSANGGNRAKAAHANASHDGEPAGGTLSFDAHVAQLHAWADAARAHVGA